MSIPLVRGQEWPAAGLHRLTARPLTLKDPRVMVVLRGLRWIVQRLGVRWLGLRAAVFGLVEHHVGWYWVGV
jgi:hypothetical protein